MSKRTKESDMQLPETNIFRLTSTWVKEAPKPFWKPIVDTLLNNHFVDSVFKEPPSDKVQEQAEIFMAPTLIKVEEQEEGSDR